jgi:hypothetical protein
MFGQGMLSKNMDLRRREYKEVGVNYTVRILVIYTACKNITSITSTSIRWAGHVARMGEMIRMQGFNRKT